MNIENMPADAPLCSSGKRPFRTEHDVAAQLSNARRFRAADPNGGRRPGIAEQGYYQCPTCKWWHLVSATGRQRRSDLSNSKAAKRRRT